MLPPVRKSILYCPLTFKSTNIFVFAWKCCLIYAYFSPDSEATTFSLEKALLWIIIIMNRGLRSNKVQKGLNGGFIANTHSLWITCVICGLFKCFINYSHSDGTHSLQRCETSDVMLNFSKYVQILDGLGWVNFRFLFLFLGKLFL